MDTESFKIGFIHTGTKDEIFFLKDNHQICMILYYKETEKMVVKSIDDMNSVYSMIFRLKEQGCWNLMKKTIYEKK